MTSKKIEVCEVKIVKTGLDYCLVSIKYRITARGQKGETITNYTRAISANLWERGQRRRLYLNDANERFTYGYQDLAKDTWVPSSERKAQGFGFLATAVVPTAIAAINENREDFEKRAQEVGLL